MKNKILFSVLFIAFLLPGIQGLNAQPITSHQIDSITEKVLKAFDVPGIAVAVVKDGKVIHQKGYGVRSLRTGEKVDQHTLFGIASNSKAFTAAALGMLVDEGKLNWDDKVRKYIPEFTLYAPFVSENFTITDLLTHRSGLGLGAGDLMIWPGDNSFTKQQIIHNLRYLKQVSDFRTKWDYDNLLYIVAGEVVKKVSGKSWEEFVEQRIMKPLGMTESAASFTRLKDSSNVIDPHAPVNGKVQAIHRELIETANAAGGIYSNLEDMTKWITMQLNDGKYGEKLGQQLFSPEVHWDMWSMHTIMDVYPGSRYNTHFAGYGLGWFLNDEMGYKTVSHTGGLAGIVTQVLLVPELKLGMLVFTNQQSGAAFSAITTSIRDAYYGVKGKDRIKEYLGYTTSARSNADKILDSIYKKIDNTKETPALPLPKYAGTYQDPWFGKITLTEKAGKLFFQAEKSPKLHGQISFITGNTFAVKWDDRAMEADAYMLFSLDYNGDPYTIQMKPISPLTDFSYDFQDLNFTKIK